MSQEKVSTSTSVPEIREDSARLYMSVESEITEPMKLQQTIRDLQLELRDVTAQNDFYKARFQSLQDKIKKIDTTLMDYKSKFEDNLLKMEMEAFISDEHKEMLNSKVLKLEKQREKDQKEIDSLKEALDVLQTEKQNEKVFNTMPKDLSDARDEVTLLESKLRKTEAEKENLLAEVHTLQENEKVLSQKNNCLTAELAHLQSVTEQKHEEIGNLRQKIFTLEDQVKKAEADKQAPVESVGAKMHTEIQTMCRLLELQGKADSLLHEKNCAVAELAQVESLGEEQRKEIGKLRRAVGDSENQRAKALNEIMKKDDELEKQKRVIADKQEEINDLKQKIFTLEDQVKKAEADKQAPVESVGAKMHTEIQTMCRLLELQGKADSLLHEKNCAVAELAQVESLGEEQRKEIGKLRRAVGDSENQRAKALNEIMKKDDELEKQKRVIADKQEEINDLKQKIFTLEDQVKKAEADKQAPVESVEAKMQTEIQTMKSTLHELQGKANSLLHQKNRAVAELAQVESLGEEQLKEIAKLRSTVGENQQAKAINEIMKMEGELEKQKRVIADKQEEINDLNKDREIISQTIEDLKDLLSLVQEEKILAEKCEMDKSEKMEDPVANLPPNMVQNSGSWFHCAKHVFKLGLGLATTSLLIPAGVLAASMFPPGCIYNLLELYCNFENGPGPF